MLTFDIDFDLNFGIPNRAIHVEVNIEDNQVPEELKHSDDSTITDRWLDKCTSSTPTAQFEEG